MSEIDFKKIICIEAGCTVSVDGKCLEGLTLSECKHHRPISEVNNIEEKEETVTSKQEIFDTVYSGDALSLDQCRSITTSALTRVIMLAGRADAGKTTLLASLFELFQKESSYAGYTFAGSRTLIGFEKRCHDSRIASERNEPKTGRTTFTPDDPRFLHLKIKNTETDVLRNILFTDISGEHFRQLSNSTEECKKFTIGKRADHFALFLDADMLSNPQSRQQAKTNALSILRSLAEAKTLTPTTLIEIIFSRWDLLEIKRNNNHVQFIESIKSDIKAKFPENQWVVRFFEVASRPKNGSALTFGHGIEHLLKIWTEETLFTLSESKRNADFSYQTNNIKREYLKYKFN